MALDVDAAANKAFEDHVGHLIDVLLTNHNPFNTAQANDHALHAFEVGFQHFLAVRNLALDIIRKNTPQ